MSPVDLASPAAQVDAMKLVHPPQPVNDSVRAFLDIAGFGDAGPCLAVAAKDEMYQYALGEFHHSSPERAIQAYFRSGAAACRILGRLLDWRFPARPAGLRVLDFASGYGRMTRFLKVARPELKVTVCEIDPDAVAFQRQWLGVEGEVSTTDPADLGVDGPWDCIFVASLFSHLPERTFEAWLEALYRRLAPGGVLIFSVHDEAVLLPGRTMPESGFYFEAMSESEFLSTEDYGSAWVREAYVRDAVARVAASHDSEAPIVGRVPQGLWHLQDLYIAVRPGTAEVPPPDSISPDSIPLGRGIEGHLDGFEWSSEGGLSLEGWAVDHDLKGFPEALTLQIEGIDPATARELLQPALGRPDVASFLRDERFVTSGFRLELPQDLIVSPDLLVTLTAEGQNGQEILFVGTLESALQSVAREKDVVRRGILEARLATLEQDLAASRGRTAGLQQRLTDVQQRFEDLGWQRHVLEEQIRSMEASFFWKLRNRWFALKGAGGD
ncbi:MAG: class I SAM-dependent methyltransferase [Acidobacteriota bacterium]